MNFRARYVFFAKDELSLITVTEYQNLLFVGKRRKRRNFGPVLQTTWGSWKSQKVLILYNPQTIFSMLILKLES